MNVLSKVGNSKHLQESFLNFGMWVEEKQIIKSWKHAKNNRQLFIFFMENIWITEIKLSISN